MAGMVNPVICEAVNEIAFVVIGADTVVTLASEAGQLQLNAFEPVIAHALLESLKFLTAGAITLRTNCVEGITANEAHLYEQVTSFVGVFTAFTPHIGYELPNLAWHLLVPTRTAPGCARRTARRSRRSVSGRRR